MALASAGRAADDGDIVWKTYTLVAYPGDGRLTCAGLNDEIARVNGDIAEMDKARERVEQNIQTAFDLDRYSSRNGHGNLAYGTNGSGKSVYAKSRDDIVKSIRVAANRVAYLTTLVPQCKERPAPAP